MRKTRDVKIEFEGRDKGKVFVLQEMSSLRAERWGIRAINALVRAGVQMPEGMEMAGMAALVRVGISSISLIPLDDLRELMDEMFSCIRVRPDPRNSQILRDLVDDTGDGDDIQEVKTRVFLRQKLMELHVGFSGPGES